MDYDKLIERLRTDSLYADKASLEIMDLCMDAASAIEALRAGNADLREQVRQLETRAGTERCDATDYDCQELGALRREVSSLRERLAADEWIDPAVELPPDDDIVLAIVSGKPAESRPV